MGYVYTYFAIQLNTKIIIPIKTDITLKLNITLDQLIDNNLHVPDKINFVSGEIFNKTDVLHYTINPTMCHFRFS